MSKIEKAFENKKAFIPFVTAGDPTLDVTEQLLYEMQKAGADLIEIGIPFSDPTAEGPVIQEANERALAEGCTTDKIFDMLKRAKEKITVPMVFLTYVNPIFTYGKERFMKQCVESGIDGLIVPDMPYEEREELAPACEKYGVDIIPLIAPTSHERIKMIAKKSKNKAILLNTAKLTDNAQKTDPTISSLAINALFLATNFSILAFLPQTNHTHMTKTSINKCKIQANLGCSTIPKTSLARYFP